MSESDWLRSKFDHWTVLDGFGAQVLKTQLLSLKDSLSFKDSGTFPGIVEFGLKNDISRLVQACGIGSGPNFTIGLPWVGLATKVGKLSS